MNRFLGMMPATEVEIQKCYKDPHGLSITIEAGVNGWTIIFADSSTRWEDVKSSSEDNFKSAYDIATSLLGELKEIKN